MAIVASTFKLYSLTGKFRILHLSWLAFFLSFVVWFNHAPLLAAIRHSFTLSEAEVKALLVLNVALTIPARILIGMLVDRIGPRLTFSMLLALGGGLCFFFAMADSYRSLALARFLLGFVGAGFVVGTRMIAEWFPAREVGLAHGIYAGWGNFGSAAGALLLPSLALAFGGADGWRYAVAVTGAIAVLYALVYYLTVRDTPEGSTYFQPAQSGGLEVTSRGDLLAYIVINIPLYLALGVLANQLAVLGLLSAGVVTVIDAVLACLYLGQSYRIYRINAKVFRQPVADIHRYKFKQVAILSLAYFVTFGSELAVVSMLPLFFMETYDLSAVAAGMLAAPFGLVVLFMRPLGGWVSDRCGRKRTLATVMLGLACGYALLSQIDAGWPLGLAVSACVACALFVHLGTGAVFAIVPLIQRRLTGQIAGLAGAYGNLGGVVFLSVLAAVDPHTFFLAIAASAVLILGAVLFLDEPKGAMAEVLPDGTVQLIDVS
ncbi:MAG: NarK family nitrate/nitrite MFS transporter [Gammaproteobacteria bacterium]